MIIGPAEYSNNSYLARHEEPIARSASSSIITEIAKETLKEFGRLLRIDQTLTGLFTSPCTTLVRKIVPLGLMIASFSVMGGTYGIYVVAINCLFGGAINAYLNTNQDIRNKLDRNYFPTSTLIKNLLIGVFAFFPIINIKNLVVNGNVLTLKQFEQLPSKVNQDIGKLLQAPGITGIFMMLFGCVMAPIVEELMFRGAGADTILIKTKSTEIHKPTITEIRNSSEFKTWDKIKTVIKTSLLFGFVHLSPFQGWSNISIFSSATTLGLLYGLLAELTGDLWASTLVHVMDNLLATFILRAG